MHANTEATPGGRSGQLCQSRVQSAARSAVFRKQARDAYDAICLQFVQHARTRFRERTGNPEYIRRMTEFRGTADKITKKAGSGNFRSEPAVDREIRVPIRVAPRCQRRRAMASARACPVTCSTTATRQPFEPCR